MKKAISLAVVVLMLAMSMVSAFAASGVNDAEQSILDFLKSEVTLSDGSTATIPTEYVNQAENYFNRDDVELTEAQAAEVIGYVQQGKDVVVKYDQTDLNKLSYDVKREILNCGKKAAAVGGLTLTFDKASKTVVITDADGVIVFQDSATLIKTTGASNVDMSAAIVVIAAFAAVIAASAFVARKVRA